MAAVVGKLPAGFIGSSPLCRFVHHEPTPSKILEKFGAVSLVALDIGGRVVARLAVLVGRGCLARLRRLNQVARSVRRSGPLTDDRQEKRPQLLGVDLRVPDGGKVPAAGQDAVG